MHKTIEFKIIKGVKTPVYQQIVDKVISSVEEGALSKNDQIPSINKIANENKIARETVVKAFKILQERGIIKSIHGKGFFILSDKVEAKHRVFLLMDVLTPYKQKLYNAIKSAFDHTAFIDVYFHHYNLEVFRKQIEDAQGNYTSYIIVPFDHEKIASTIDILPREKVLIVDQKPKSLGDDRSGVYQDFEQNVSSALSELQEQISTYDQLTLIFRNDVTIVPNELRIGFENYCAEKKINAQVVTEFCDYKPQVGEAFVVIDDEDLVYLVEYCMDKGYQIGKEIGIMSYNETSFKRVISGGISVVSTNWELMGKTAAEMITKNQYQLVSNSCEVTNRRSF